MITMTTYTSTMMQYPNSQANKHLHHYHRITRHGTPADHHSNRYSLQKGLRDKMDLAITQACKSSTLGKYNNSIHHFLTF